MKSLLLPLIIGTAFACAQEKEIFFSEIHEVLPDLSEWSALVIKVHPGDELPLGLKLSGDVLELCQKGEGGTLRALEPLYIRIEPSFSFSQDKREWKSFEEFFTGSLGFSVANPQTGEIFLDLHKR